MKCQKISTMEVLRMPRLQSAVTAAFVAPAAAASPPPLSAERDDRSMNRKAPRVSMKLLEAQHRNPEEEDLAGKPPTDHARVAAAMLQSGAFNAAMDFFAGSSSYDEGGCDEDAESKALEFFLGIFEKDGALRGYYEKHREAGWFSCLLCRRKVKDCVRLVQHSQGVTAGRRKAAHRAFGKAVCLVLGWDVNRLPSIALGLLPLVSTGATAEPKDDKHNEPSICMNEDVVKEGIVKEKMNEDLTEDNFATNGLEDISSMCFWTKKALHLHSQWHPGSLGNAKPNTAASIEPLALSSKMEERLRTGQAYTDERNVLRKRHKGNEKEWPNNLALQPSREAAEWDKLSGKPPTKCPALSAVQQDPVAAALAQDGACKAANEFFSGSSFNGKKEREDAIEDNEWDNEALSKALVFFLGLYKKDSILMEYYLKHRKDGLFSCLACGRKEAQEGKSFKSCSQLIQHCRDVTKKRMIAHRAFGMAVCTVLGLDANWGRSRSIDIDVRGAPGNSLAGATTKLMDNKHKESFVEMKGVSPFARKPLRKPSVFWQRMSSISMVSGILVLPEMPTLIPPLPECHLPTPPRRRRS